ncbi:NAD(P)/FAD-dependent oxidoreductase [Streptomyces sp. NRRL B-3229]|uniref:NAD(P)/FAD-dependent oxidoreductase n=1 Tax=Streptomyces sp. NRRL B-3229 TaxID=1463836 RepID=UPI003B67D523
MTEVIGEEVLEELDVVDNRTGVHRRLAARSLFVLTGAEPHTEWLAGTVALDSRGFVVTGPEAQEACAHPEVWHGRGPSCMTLEAGLPGVFAVGDVRSGSVKRVASAAGEGAMAVHSVHRHLGHAAVPGNPGTPTVTGRSDVSRTSPRGCVTGSPRGSDEKGGCAGASDLHQLKRCSSRPLTPTRARVR